MNKAEFQKARTEIVNGLIENKDEHGIYPITECYDKLDDLYAQVIKATKKRCAGAIHKCIVDTERRGYSPSCLHVREKMLAIMELEE